MVLKADQLRVKALLTETITLLCKNGLNYRSEFAIEALIGITLDKDDVFLISIKETIDGGTGVLDAGDDSRHGMKRDFVIDVRKEDDTTASFDDSYEMAAPSSPSQSQASNSIQSFRSVSYLKKRRSAGNSVSDNKPVSCSLTRTDNVASDRLSCGDQHSVNQNIHIKQEPDIVLIKDEEISGTFQDNSFASNDASLGFGAGGFLPPPMSNFGSNAYKDMCEASHAFVDEPLQQASYESSAQYNSEQGTTRVQHVTSDDVTTAHVFMCDVCGMTFKRQDALTDHVRGVHRATFDYKCEACGHAFRWRSMLSYHRRKKCSILLATKQK